MRAHTSATFQQPGWISPLLLALLLALLHQTHVASAAASSEAEQFFSGTNVLVIRIDISNDGVAELTKAHLKNPVRPTAVCTVTEAGIVYTNVAVHLKGAAGSFRPIDQKPGFTLNFGKSGGAQRFHGLTKLSLNNSVQDPAYVSEKLCREMYEAAGVPVPRVGYARVNLNGRELGFYILAEGWSKEFLKRYFKNAKGNFYDPGLARDIDSEMSPKFGNDPEDNSNIKALIAASKEKDLTKRLAKLEKVLDLDRFITLLALDSLTWNWDGYGLDKNNYRAFQDLDRGQIVFFPHGMDQMFWRPEAPIMPSMNGLVARAVIRIPEVRLRYLDRISQLCSTVFQLEKMTNRVRQLGEIVLPGLRAAGYALEANEYPDSLQLTQDRIVARVAVVKKQREHLGRLLKFEGTQPLQVKGWTQVSKIGDPLNRSLTEAKLLQIEGREAASKQWGTLVVLAEGVYRIEGRVKVEGVPVKQVEASPGEVPNLTGAGFRVWSRRKFSEGVEWKWFPYSESRNFKKRGLLPPKKGSGQGLNDTSDWTTISYEFEMKQPMADLNVFFELRENAGKAILDADSVRISRVGD
ncbi:MAG TPA: CotH kinase family protein [Candidatus Saccharimonadales bacterium]|nr:CotH kinase family protein [Candidatus Saccharimonadales bacterium]